MTSGEAATSKAKVEQTREELGETVELLAAKADVKAQAQQKLAEGREALKVKGEQIKEKAADLSQRVQDVTPERAQQVAGQAVEKAKERPVLFAAVGAFLLGVVSGRVFRRRKA